VLISAQRLETKCISIIVDLGILDSSVGIATAYGLGGPGSIADRTRLFSTSQRPDRLQGPPSLLSNGYRGHFSGAKAAEA
jgi:hypothetical protein